MILSFTGTFGETISLDLRQRFGDRVELQCFQFIVPPIEFRLLRNGTVLLDWQDGNTDLYDLQHSPGVKEWSRGTHRFFNDLDHRQDVMTCGVLSENVHLETRGLAGRFRLLVWPRESTCRKI